MFKSILFLVFATIRHGASIRKCLTLCISYILLLFKYKYEITMAIISTNPNQRLRSTGHDAKCATCARCKTRGHRASETVQKGKDKHINEYSYYYLSRRERSQSRPFDMPRLKMASRVRDARRGAVEEASKEYEALLFVDLLIGRLLA